MDAGGGDEVEGSVADDPDASEDVACVPFAIEQDAGACFGNDLAQGSAHALMLYGDAGRCGEVPTPQACQCQETYDCTCFDAHHVIDGDDLCAGTGSWGGCQMINGLPVVRCL